MPHRYHVGEEAFLLPARGSSARLAGRCEILAVLPLEHQPQQYRIKSAEERHERIVSENDLQPMIDPVPQSAL